MYKVNNALTSAYGNPMDMQDLKPKQGPVSVLIHLFFKSLGTNFKVPWDHILVYNRLSSAYLRFKRTNECFELSPLGNNL